MYTSPQNIVIACTNESEIHRGTTETGLHRAFKRDDPFCLAHIISIAVRKPQNMAKQPDDYVDRGNMSQIFIIVSFSPHVDSSYTESRRFSTTFDHHRHTYSRLRDKFDEMWVTYYSMVWNERPTVDIQLLWVAKNVQDGRPGYTYPIGSSLVHKSVKFS